MCLCAFLFLGTWTVVACDTRPKKYVVVLMEQWLSRLARRSKAAGPRPPCQAEGIVAADSTVRCTTLRATSADVACGLTLVAHEQHSG